jgi:hypothetical protein
LIIPAILVHNTGICSLSGKRGGFDPSAALRKNHPNNQTLFVYYIRIEILTPLFIGVNMAEKKNTNLDFIIAIWVCVRVVNRSAFSSLLWFTLSTENFATINKYDESGRLYLVLKETADYGLRIVNEYQYHNARDGE